MAVKRAAVPVWRDPKDASGGGDVGLHNLNVFRRGSHIRRALIGDFYKKSKEAAVVATAAEKDRRARQEEGEHGSSDEDGDDGDVVNRKEGGDDQDSSSPDPLSSSMETEAIVALCGVLKRQPQNIEVSFPFFDELRTPRQLLCLIYSSLFSYLSLSFH